MPAIIDSQGKPGIAGKTSGVETPMELEVEVETCGAVVLLKLLTAELVTAELALAELLATLEVKLEVELEDTLAVVVVVTGGGV
jgi:hypothetical protein